MNSFIEKSKNSMYLIKKVMKCVTFIIIVGICFRNTPDFRNLQNTLQIDLYDKEAYTPYTYSQYTESLRNANEFYWNIFASSEEINSANNDLIEKISLLELKGNKTALINKYIEWTCMITDYYVPKSKEEVNKMLNTMKSVLIDENATVSDVNNILKDADRCFESLIRIPDKSVLIQTFEAYQEEDLEQYLPITVEEFSGTMEIARDVIEDENSSQSEVDKAIENLDAKFEALVIKPDKSYLISLYEKADNLSNNKYTTVTYKAFKEKYGVTKETIENVNATQEDVSDAVKYLEDCFDELIVATTGVYRVSLSSYRSWNNHVGNSWSEYYYRNGSSFSGYGTITAPIDSYTDFSIKIVENDTIPDVGWGSIGIYLKDENTATTQIVVRENRGRYSGNTAGWNVECSVSVVELK